MSLRIIKRNKDYACIEQIGNIAGKNVNVLYSNSDISKVKDFIKGKGI